MNLYEITSEQKALINKIELLEGEITEEIENALIINENQLQSKSIAYLSVIKNKPESLDLNDWLMDISDEDMYTTIENSKLKERPNAIKAKQRDNPAIK